VAPPADKSGKRVFTYDLPSKPGKDGAPKRYVAANPHYFADVYVQVPHEARCEPPPPPPPALAPAPPRPAPALEASPGAFTRAGPHAMPTAYCWRQERL
jgi:hypothetical protein